MYFGQTYYNTKIILYVIFFEKVVKWCTKTQELDEYLVELAGKTFLSRKEQDLIKIEVHSKVQDIVQLINRNYQHF